MELTTTGWEVPDNDFRKLTKKVATERINYLLNEGVNPDRIKAVPDND